MSAWFETWFDSPFYHRLYKDRDSNEAAAFIQKLVNHLQPSANELCLDLACGKGRHSIQLNKLGLHVHGADYSVNSIATAKEHENDRLKFYEHDMREALPHQYDIILNLFTSFGYFDSLEEHTNTLNHIYHALSKKGRFVFDFMNSNYVINHLVEDEIIIKDKVEFNISRRHIDGRINKEIRFLYEGGEYSFKESVMAFDHDSLLKMMKDCGFKHIKAFGDYNFEPFDLQRSKRLILILAK
jgi:SAM-dependent methyltransferase